MNYCTLDNGNSKANKHALNIKHAVSWTKKVWLGLFVFLAKQNFKQTNVKGEKPKSERIWKVCKDAAIKTCSNAVWVWSYWKNGTGSMKAWQTKMQI